MKNTHFLKTLCILMFSIAALFMSLAPVSAHSAIQVIAIKTIHSVPHLPQQEMSIECRKHLPCFTIENATHQTVFFWYDRGKFTIPGSHFQGTILKPGHSKTFTLTDQNSDCSCSTHFFRIWYHNENTDILIVHTF